MQAADATTWFAVVLATAIATASWMTFCRVRGTTLAAPAAWCVASALAIAVVEFGLARRGVAESTLAASLWRYAAAVGSFCPLMAVLGAKRPQDRGWQWVVASLWLVLLVPAGQALASGAGSQLELFPAWQMLLWTMGAMTLLNYLPTRRMLAALAFAAGQGCLMAPYLASPPLDLWPTLRCTGLAFMLAAFPLAGLLSKRGESRAHDHSLDGARERWLTFRNAWGAFWALRVMQRINQSAEHGGWPIRLHWDGFASPANSESADEPHLNAQIEQAMDAVLRRFERVED